MFHPGTVPTNPNRESLSRERILRTALGLVDRDGLETVSMRRLAESLGVEAMSIYHHLPNKAAMLDGIVGIVLAELGPLRPSDSWESIVLVRARKLRSVLLEHPNALPLFTTRSVANPDSASYFADLVEQLTRHGFTPNDATRTIEVVFAFVVGHTASRSAPSVFVRDRKSGRDDRIDARSFPRILEAARIMDRSGANAAFEFGLKSMIEGIASRRTRRVRGAE